MLLKNILQKPKDSYIYLERYVNNKSPSGIHNTTSASTSPDSENTFFSVKQLKFRRSIQIRDFGVKHEGVLMDNCIHVHPDMLEEAIFRKSYGLYNFEEDIAVIPTASGRTVKIVDKEYFIKLSYSKPLGRIKRILSAKEVNAACETTALLVNAVDFNRMNPKFSFLKEDYGRVVYLPIDNELIEWGTVIREVKPYPYNDCDYVIIPFFSLFASDRYSDDIPLVLQLYHNSDKSINKFLLEDILYPLYNTYFDALIYCGIELEAHAQNMLISLTIDGSISRIICRDLESAGRDIPLMEIIGINTNFESYPYKCNEYSNEIYSGGFSKYVTIHSFMFDFKLGEYITTPLLKCVEQYYDGKDFDVNYIIRNLKEFNKQYIGMLPKDFFPQKKWCNYDNIIFEGAKRTYNWFDNPKYR